jgi:uncharacterized membrane protein
MFRFIERMDRTTAWLNIYYLLFVTLVPFTTGLYAGNENSRIANTVFGSNLIILGLLSYAMWVYSIRAGHADSDLPTPVRSFTSQRLLMGPLLAGIGMTASLFQPVFAEYIFFAMVPIFMFSVRFSPLRDKEIRGNNS